MRKMTVVQMHSLLFYSIIQYIPYVTGRRKQESTDIREPMSTNKKDINDLSVVLAQSAILKAITTIQVCIY